MADQNEKKSSTLDELKQISDLDSIAEVDYKEPELQSFDATNVFEIDDSKKNKKTRFRFGKRSQRESSHVVVRGSGLENHDVEFKEIRFSDDPNEVEDTLEIPSREEIQKVPENNDIPEQPKVDMKDVAPIVQEKLEKEQIVLGLADLGIEEDKKKEDVKQEPESPEVETPIVEQEPAQMTEDVPTIKEEPVVEQEEETSVDTTEAVEEPVHEEVPIVEEIHEEAVEEETPVQEEPTVVEQEPVEEQEEDLIEVISLDDDLEDQLQPIEEIEVEIPVEEEKPTVEPKVRTVEEIQEERSIEEVPIVEEIAKETTEQPNLENTLMGHEIDASAIVDATGVKHGFAVDDTEIPLGQMTRDDIDQLEVVYEVEEEEDSLDNIPIQYIDHADGQVKRKRNRDAKPATFEPFDFTKLSNEDIYEDTKRFSLDSYDKEAAYLEKQSKKGYHFVHKSGKRYYFQSGEPADYIYQVNYYSQMPTEDDVADWDDKGWVYIDRYASRNKDEAGWFILRHRDEPNKASFELFNDDQRMGYIRQYVASIRSSVFLIFICMACCVVSTFLQYRFQGPMIGVVISAVLLVVALIAYISYYRVLRRARKLLAVLKNRVRVHENQVKLQDQSDQFESTTQLAFDWEQLNSEER